MLPVSLPLTVFLPLLLQSPMSLWCKCYTADLPVRAGYYLVTCSLHFYSLWFSAMVSTYCKGKFPDRGVRALLPYGYKDTYLEWSQRFCWLSKVAVVGSPPRSMSSLTPSSWLGFHDFSLDEQALKLIGKLLITTNYAFCHCTLRVIAQRWPVLWFIASQLGRIIDCSFPLEACMAHSGIVKIVLRKEVFRS